MTNKEAYNILYNGLIEAPSEQEWCTAFRIAIEALKQKQESCEDEDIISRENVMTALRADPFFTCSGDQLNAIRIVETMPPVIPQPKIGHWIIVDDCEQFIAKCSECGRIEDSRMINKYPYCHCGAKMQEVEE